MENILLKYMVERFNKHDTEYKIFNTDFPFVTISREYGCPSKDIAELLVQKINKHLYLKNNAQVWKMISKEILENTSKELSVDPKRIQKFFDVQNRTTIDEILDSLSAKYYQSDKTVKKTLTIVISDFAKKGNVVIVGRGGVCVTNNLKNGIHIRLKAPLEWRAQKILEANHIRDIEEAKKLALDIDSKRIELLKIMSNNCFNESFFDITYNCKSFNNEEIADSIIYHLGLKSKIMI
ncbi:MAG: AAA family ATPase [Bacteroidales bacterium]